MNPDRQYYLNLKWSYPIRLENIDLDKEDSHTSFEKRGIYLITRQFTATSKEETIYIGKTCRSFRWRLKEHTTKDFSNWTKAHGIIRIRVAEVLIKPGMSEEEYDKIFLEDIESALIFEKKPSYNTQKVRSYHFYQDLHIVNNGIRSELLAKEIFNRNH